MRRPSFDSHTRDPRILVCNYEDPKTTLCIPDRTLLYASDCWFPSQLAKLFKSYGLARLLTLQMVRKEVIHCRNALISPFERSKKRRIMRALEAAIGPSFEAFDRCGAFPSPLLASWFSKISAFDFTTADNASLFDFTSFSPRFPYRHHSAFGRQSSLCFLFFVRARPHSHLLTPPSLSTALSPDCLLAPATEINLSQSGLNHRSSVRVQKQSYSRPRLSCWYGSSGSAWWRWVATRGAEGVVSFFAILE